jgi:thiosulfate/3-mercaptopyruvate sulfurtransferase
MREGRPVVAAAPVVTRTTFIARPRASNLDAPAVAASLAARSLLLVDARARDRFRGDVEPLDPVAGHIPGALNRPYAENLDAEGRFKPAGMLAAEFGALLGGRTPAGVVHYCGSGVSACHNLLAMAHAGLDGARLYPGSWSEWCAEPTRPSARGDA